MRAFLTKGCATRLSGFQSPLENPAPSLSVAPIISNCIQDNIDKPVKDIGEALYNVAVELAVLNNLIAFCYDIDKDNIDDVYELCKREVAKTNGLFDFRQAHRLQNQEQYNQWQR